MKKTILLTAVLGLGLSSLTAQTVPLFINYQGKVTASDGSGLGTGTPVNRKVIFRIYDAPTAGNKIWGEQQTVTMSNGEFSVLLGQGIALEFDPAPATPRPALDTVFTTGSAARYLEITVDNGDNTLTAADAPITPRQQITTTAYSFRARSADTIATGNDLQLNNSTNYGLGYYGTGRLFNGRAVDGPVLYGNAGGALGSNVNGTQNIALQWNASGNVTVGGTTATSRLDVAGGVKATGVDGFTFNTNDLDGGLFSPADGVVTIKTNGAERLRVDSAGNLGIGVTPTSKLHVLGSMNIQGTNSSLQFTDFAPGQGGTTTLAAQLTTGTAIAPQFRFVKTGNFIDIGQNAAGDFVVENSFDSAILTASQGGLVGINMAPDNGSRLAVNNSVGVYGTNPFYNLFDTTNFYRGGMGLASSTGSWSTDAAINDMVIRSGANKLILQSGSGVSAISINSSNRVGIGVADSASAKLEVNGEIRITTGDILINAIRYDGMSWRDASNAPKARLFRYGLAGQNQALYVSNNGSSDLTGVYLASGGTGWTSTSDIRLKSKIEPLSGILEKIKDIRVVGFNMAGQSVDRDTGKVIIEKSHTDKKMKDGRVIKDQIGTIAQDWIKDFPELLVEPEGKDGYYGLNYDRVGVVALGAVKELHQVVLQKTAEIETLKAQNTALAEKVAALEARDKAVELRFADLEKQIKSVTKTASLPISLPVGETAQ